jgi:hypothetical protein
MPIEEEAVLNINANIRGARSALISLNTALNGLQTVFKELGIQLDDTTKKALAYFELSVRIIQIAEASYSAIKALIAVKWADAIASAAQRIAESGIGAPIVAGAIVGGMAIAGIAWGLTQGMPTTSPNVAAVTAVQFRRGGRL